jgi:hypothetical protein
MQPEGLVCNGGCQMQSLAATEVVADGASLKPGQVHGTQLKNEEGSEDQRRLRAEQRVRTVRVHARAGRNTARNDVAGGGQNN